MTSPRHHHVGITLLIVLVAVLGSRTAMLNVDTQKHMIDARMLAQLQSIQARIETLIWRLGQQRPEQTSTKLASLNVREREALGTHLERIRVHAANASPVDPSVTIWTSPAGTSYITFAQHTARGTIVTATSADHLLGDAAPDKLLDEGAHLVVQLNQVALWQSTFSPLDWHEHTFRTHGATWTLKLAPPPDTGATLPWVHLTYAWLVALGIGAVVAMLANRSANGDETHERVSNLNRQLSAQLDTAAELERQLIEQSNVDVETGLLKPRPFLRVVKLCQQRLQAGEWTSAAVICVHLNQADRLRAQSDTCLAEVLKRVFAAVAGQLPGEWSCSRYHETCLMFLYPNSARMGRSPGSTATHLSRILSEPLLVHGETFWLDASVQMRDIETDTDVDTLCRGLASRIVIEPKPAAPSRPQPSEQPNLHRELPDALHNGQIELFYQPIVQAKSRQLHGFESLIRWRHPTAGILSPAAFLPAAESLGLMTSISNLVVEIAAKQLTKWDNDIARALYISVNLRAEDFLSPNFIPRILSTLDEAAIPHERMRFEITEQTMFADIDAASDVIRNLRKVGIDVMLDDFGTGYSSLSYLRKLEPRVVKLDKSFVDDIGGDSHAFGMMKGLIDLLHYLEFDCVAEGVESDEQLEMLRIANCDYIQGYLFSKPLDAASASTLAIEGSQTIKPPGPAVTPFSRFSA